MKFDEKLPQGVQDALNKGLLGRLPVTFQPFTRQHLRDWEFLFPRERQSVLRLLVYLSGLNGNELAARFREVVQLEEKMGVRQWQFSTDEQTIQNASLLARSGHYQEWRQAVQKIFDAADEHAGKDQDKGRRRLIVLVLPQRLPLERSQIWQRWQGVGRPIRLDLTLHGAAKSAADALIFGTPNVSDAPNGKGPLEMAARGPEASTADAWLVEVGQDLAKSALNQAAAGTSEPAAMLLSHERLAEFRDQFSHEINSIRKDLSDADGVYSRLRKMDVAPWCPAEVAARPVVREFLRTLYLSGNGALIFGNSFVEWCASEALRRARPSLLVAQFGVRSKPKPFTSVAVFENPDQINPLPAVEDLPGSAMDAQILAHYVWLAASRYDEYRSNTVCLCLAESLAEAYLVAPAEFALWRQAEPVSLSQLRQSLTDWLAEEVG